MTAPRLALIAALGAEDRAIGASNRLPWHLPEDLKHFRRLTRGNPVVMGRKTYDSIGRALPDRPNWVISRQAGLIIPGCRVVGSLEQALVEARAVAANEVFVIGGAEIYTQALPRADRLYLTLVETRVAGADAFFPEWRDQGFVEIESRPAEASDPSGPRYRFTLWERARPSRP